MTLAAAQLLEGKIPPSHIDQLPDNAVWVENTSAVG